MIETVPEEPSFLVEGPGALSLWRARWFGLCLLVIMLVSDGWSGRPLGLAHQLILLPFTFLFLYSLLQLLFARAAPGQAHSSVLWDGKRLVHVLFLVELSAFMLFRYEAHHLAPLGYRLRPTLSVPAVLAIAAGFWLVQRNPRPAYVAGLAAGVYGLGVLLTIGCFPLNYLRSDMLPVILWADTNLLHHVSPYATMHVADRVYDFPYLPGMLVAYLPFVALHMDQRFASILAMSAIAFFVFRAARPEYKLPVAGLLAVLLLDPFLQYRHDLYLQPHWLTLVGAFLFMQRGRWVWAAFILGLGMAMYQFSWIVLPFVLLNALWRRGWLESLKLFLAAAAGALLIAGPFLRSAFARISSNTVGQWGRFEHALADPMNLSYWLTYLVHPDKLLRIQAVLMVGIFAWCLLRRRCTTLEDTLRWTVVALTLFILCNSIVDGYFFLMLLVPMLLYTLVANGWLRPPDQPAATTAAA
jgi:hypothetical protein